MIWWYHFKVAQCGPNSSVYLCIPQGFSNFTVVPILHSASDQRNYKTVSAPALPPWPSAPRGGPGAQRPDRDFGSASAHCRAARPTNPRNPTAAAPTPWVPTLEAPSRLRHPRPEGNGLVAPWWWVKSDPSDVSTKVPLHLRLSKVIFGGDSGQNSALPIQLVGCKSLWMLNSQKAEENAPARRVRKIALHLHSNQSGHQKVPSYMQPQQGLLQHWSCFPNFHPPTLLEALWPNVSTLDADNRIHSVRSSTSVAQALWPGFWVISTRFTTLERSQDIWHPKNIWI